MNDLTVDIKREGKSVRLCSEVGDIYISSSACESLLSKFSDFAVWFFLPVAMRLGRNLLINGGGCEKTKQNGEMLSLIWEQWLPNHFQYIKIKYSDLLYSTPECQNLSCNSDLLLYSGGVDSMFCLLKRIREKKTQDMLTVHGMDYKYKDESRFCAFVKKTSPITLGNCTERIFCKTNAYDLYRDIGCNPKKTHITHIFVLAGAGFLHAAYKKILMAADYRLDQQFLVFPWGSNSATNRYFKNAHCELITLNDDISRSDKLPVIATNIDALSSLSFCANYESRPENCGKCQKCIRTKLMFISRLGYIPSGVFREMAVPEYWYLEMKASKKSNYVFMLDIISSAKKHGNTKLISGYNKAVEYCMKYQDAKKQKSIKE